MPARSLSVKRRTTGARTGPEDEVGPAGGDDAPDAAEVHHHRPDPDTVFTNDADNFLSGRCKCKPVNSQ